MGWVIGNLSFGFVVWGIECFGVLVFICGWRVGLFDYVGFSA